MKKLLVAFLIIFNVSIFAADFSPAQKRVWHAGQEWAQALAARNPVKITALYDKEAYLYATFQNMFDNREEILQYFNGLMKKPNLKVTFNRESIRVYGETAINSGLYTFSYTNNGKLVKVPARYTFVYTETPHGWLIVDHHSSILPTDKK